MIHGKEIQKQNGRLRCPIGRRKTTCSKCDKEIEQNRLGQSRYCRLCANESMRNNRKKHSELTPEDRNKANARSYLNVYIRRGNIIKSPCCICGNTEVQGHHKDYSKPLDVVWLCQKHHTALHKNVITI